jgi:hypothetical protein
MVLVPSSICKQYAHSWQICYVLLLACSTSFCLRIISVHSCGWRIDLVNLVHDVYNMASLRLAN